MLDHVTIGVSNAERSKTFYARALRPLGITRLHAEGQTFAGYGVSPKAFFWIGWRPSDRRSHRLYGKGSGDGRPASPRGRRRRWHRQWRRRRLRHNDHPSYYGAFVLDPDGHSIEAVCHAPLSNS